MINERNVKALIHNLASSSDVKRASDIFLKSQRLNFFVYLKIFDDGRILRVSNHESWTKTYFNRQLYNESDFYAAHINKIDGYKPRYYFWPAQPTHRMYAEWKNLNIWNGLTCYKRKPGFIESYSLASSSENFYMNNYFINNLDRIESFISYFKQEASNILVEQNNLIFSSYRADKSLSCEKQYERAIIKDFYEETTPFLSETINLD